MIKPNVSVIMITYGHENFIEEAINSVMMQECDYEIELIIANDCSPDDTDNIVVEMLKTHKKASWIKYIAHKKNIGMIANNNFALNQAKGKYIAICEGDDYWIDPLKLQKQVDFLESNPDYTFSMGRVDMLIEKTGEIRRVKEHVDPNKSETYTLRDYLKNPFSQTSSFVFRNSSEDFPEWLHKVHAGDQSLVIIKTGKEGKIKYHKDLFSIYRLNVNSISFNPDYVNLRNKGECFLNNINAHTEYRFNSIITFRKMINRVYYYTNSKNLFVKIFSKILVIVMMKIITKM
ncbi:glycosyltransferase involved in cell wall biosynthesis [Flavobacterium tiangeerense]|uniref:Glycosyltransferase involved in cell wall biosynthesis n=1 Tax=Flavobacterium tiangeerense TaxID=459471 RepID=A0ABY3FJK6_9FLAO|nr:glycosyltransferase family 2 protein [Flavobacterium tiangeerense]TWH99144.1 glycosyltransferase involved in cell wall biosynthesis [Flavobacterium tiangeerense]